MDLPQITLLIPCFNAAPFLPRLLQGVAALTRPFSAILCYDDGSTDDTVAVARSLGLEIITGNPNRGVAHARNQLVNAATTEWIHFHDADDWIAPIFLAQLAPKCTADNDVISCDADWVDDTTGATLIRWRYDSAKLGYEPAAHLLANPMGLNNSIIRRGKWHSIGGCDESLKMWEDADVHFRLARSGARFFHVPEVLTHSLRRADSFSHDYKRSWQFRLQALERYATHSSVEQLQPILSGEAEKVATMLMGLGDDLNARRALVLCRELGGRPPTSNHPLIRTLKPLLPAHVLLRWQIRYRANLQ